MPIFLDKAGKTMAGNAYALVGERADTESERRHFIFLSLSKSKKIK